MIEIGIQEFDNKKYILYKTEIYNNNLYDIFVNLHNPNDIKIFKQIKKENEIFYKKTSQDEYLNVLALCGEY